MTARTIVSVEHAPPPHWVGDGFHVRPLFASKAFTHAVSPFLMLDYAAPVVFPPRDKPAGVGPHPHRGFETVTIVYAGEVEHRDSAGHSGKIAEGDVQWMTAASGVVHDEFHARDYARKGGPVSMAQLWVNLPAQHKMTTSRYQTLMKNDIPTVDLADDAGAVRVIAGEFAGHTGPALTYSPVSVWDARVKAGKSAAFAIAAGHRAMMPVLDGSVKIDLPKSWHADSDPVWRTHQRADRPLRPVRDEHRTGTAAGDRRFPARQDGNARGLRPPVA